MYLAFAFALWGWARSLVDDPLDLVGLTLVQVGAVAFLLLYEHLRRMDARRPVPSAVPAAVSG